MDINNAKDNFYADIKKAFAQLFSEHIIDRYCIPDGPN